MFPSLINLLPLRPYLLYALAAVACVWAGWHARSVVAEADAAKQLREAEQARIELSQKYQRASAEAASAEAQFLALNRKLSKETARETQKPDYARRLPDAGRLLFNAACCGGADAGQPDPAVP